ncbi:uncharacterized protein LOC111437549 [Cucurbita moschata]|uniref:Uncharacterized protein LOC111437549 n=1 Tax=Cucurbita moschata TaxID=3662 RepID=A0A6J1ETD3_CUCMO|nr:uncharacterized protein LOC111437549 [Cucurbita moschata]
MDGAHHITNFLLVKEWVMEECKSLGKIAAMADSVLGIVAAAAITFYAVSLSEHREKSFRDLDGSEDEKGGFKMTSSSREHKSKLKQLLLQEMFPKKSDFTLESISSCCYSTSKAFYNLKVQKQLDILDEISGISLIS